MTKSLLVFLIFFAMVGVIAVSDVTAHGEPVTLEDLPSPGMIPGSPFYFLDRFFERFIDWFTFGTEANAMLQLELAAERVAEIDALLQAKGVTAPGISVARVRLENNVLKVAELLEQARIRGKDVSALAGELDDEFDELEELFKLVLETREGALKANANELRLEILRARAMRNEARIDELVREFVLVKNELKLFDDLGDDIMEELDAAEDRLEKELKEADRALEQLEETEEEAKEKMEEGLEQEREREDHELRDVLEEKGVLQEIEQEDEEDGDNDDDLEKELERLQKESDEGELKSLERELQL